MTNTYALLRVTSSFYRHVLKAATSLPPADRPAYFADVENTLEILASKFTEPPAKPRLKPPAERP